MIQFEYLCYNVTTVVYHRVNWKTLGFRQHLTCYHKKQGASRTQIRKFFYTLPCQYFNTLLGHQLLGGCPSPSSMVLIHVLGSYPTGILSLHCWGSDIFYQATPYPPSPHLDSLWPMTHVDLLPSTTINPCYVSFWLGLRWFQTNFRFNLLQHSDSSATQFFSEMCSFLSANNMFN